MTIGRRSMLTSPDLLPEFLSPSLRDVGGRHTAEAGKESCLKIIFVEVTNIMG